MINEREIRKQLEAKQKELMEIQQQYDAMKYSRQMQAVSDRIVKSEALINIIRTDKLNGDDVARFADKILLHLNAIYGKYRNEILENQAKRLKKNEAKRSRRSRQKTKIKENNPPEQKLNELQQAENYMPAPADQVVDAKVVADPADPVMVKQNDNEKNSIKQNRTY
jgi:hypothetical protein